MSFIKFNKENISQLNLDEIYNTNIFSPKIYTNMRKPKLETITEFLKQETKTKMDKQANPILVNITHQKCQKNCKNKHHEQKCAQLI